MTEMLQRVARAIWDWQQADLPARVRREPDDMDLQTGAWARVESLAFATIEAMRKPGAKRWRHVKRGTEYVEVGRAELQIATGDVVEGSELVVYRGADGKLWAREAGEFEDGRFVPSPPSSLPQPNETEEPKP